MMDTEHASTASGLNGQVAMVTGAGRGIGRAIALTLAAAGMKVTLAARSRDQLDETEALIRQAGGQALTMPVDVTDQQAVEEMVAATTRHFGSPDLLVNNAGAAHKEAAIWELPADDWWRVLEVNLRGPFLCARAVLPAMLARQRGRIINLASNGGGWPMPTASAYSVSKAALLRLTDCLAAMTEGRGVSVFAISPGLVHTDLADGVSLFKDVPESEWAAPERAGELCAFLATGQGDGLSGRFIHVEDDIQHMAQHADQIREDDQYALRIRRPD
jgi:3-oxoacyl-[acyl-carrier protein] reductase